MFAQIVRRSQLGEVFSGRRQSSDRPFELQSPWQLPMLDPLSVAAIWRDAPAERSIVPEFLLTADGQELDWLAWLVNYSPGLRPFTAYCRVLGVSAFTRRLEEFQAPDLGSMQDAFVGLILGEVLSFEGGLNRPREPLAASACGSVLSFALSRQLAVSRSGALDDGDLANRWLRVRHLTRQRERMLDLREVNGVAEILRLMLRGGPPGSVPFAIVRACEELRAHGEVISEPEVLGPLFAGVAHAMSGTREERVEIFEHVLALALDREPVPQGSFAVGYLASRINPGTLAHAGLVTPALKRYPAAMLWYGVCAALSEGTSIYTELGGIGRRVSRELLLGEDFLSKPRTDISALELEILLRGERSDDFAVWSPSQLTVELAPCVSTVVNWSSRVRTRRSLDAAERSEERGLIESELGATISRLLDLHRRLRAEREPRDHEPEQESLFDRFPGRGPRRR